MIELRIPGAAVTAALWALLSPLLLASAACAQTPAKPPATEPTSSFAYEVVDDQQTITINNVTYQVLEPYIPGRKATQRLVLRTTTRTKSVIDEIGIEGSVTVDAWPLGTGLDRPPLYSVKLEGAGATVVNQSILVFDRAIEDVQWWSVYSIDRGRHLFDTYVPVTEFSISREYDTPRFVGLEVPPDDATDQRLREPHVVGVLTYASAERVIREALLTCDDPDRAAIYRSYADETRELTLQVGPVPPAKGKQYAGAGPDPEADHQPGLSSTAGAGLGAHSRFRRRPRSRPCQAAAMPQGSGLEAVEHFPPMWTPVRRRKCDKTKRSSAPLELPDSLAISEGPPRHLGTIARWLAP